MRNGNVNVELTIEDLRALFPDIEFRVYPQSRVTWLRYQCGYSDGDHFKLCVYAATADDLCDRLEQPAA
jgi:hypothetical protein